MKPARVAAPFTLLAILLGLPSPAMGLGAVLHSPPSHSAESASSFEHVALLSLGDRVIVTIAPDANARGAFVVPIPASAMGLRVVSAAPLDRLEELTRPRLLEVSYRCLAETSTATSCAQDELDLRADASTQFGRLSGRTPEEERLMDWGGCAFGTPEPEVVTAPQNASYLPPGSVPNVEWGSGSADQVAFRLESWGLAPLPWQRAAAAGRWAYVRSSQTSSRASRLPAIQYEVPLETAIPGFAPDDPDSTTLVSVLTTDLEATLDIDHTAAELVRVPEHLRADSVEAACGNGSGPCALPAAETDTLLSRAGISDELPQTLGAARLGPFKPKSHSRCIDISIRGGAPRLDARVRRFRLGAAMPLRLTRRDVPATWRTFVRLPPSTLPPDDCAQACLVIKKAEALPPTTTQTTDDTRLVTLSAGSPKAALERPTRETAGSNPDRTAPLALWRFAIFYLAGLVVVYWVVWRSLPRAPRKTNEPNEPNEP